jgi:hypothetical protein
MEQLKSMHQAGAFESLMRATTNMPAAILALAGSGGVPPGGANLVCTNVPGPMIPLYAVGHRMLEHYPMVPLAGDLGIGVGITSFDKGLFMGIMSDPTIIDDVDRIATYCADEFRLLREAAGVPVSDLPDFTAKPARNGNGASARPAAEPERTPEAVASAQG